MGIQMELKVVAKAFRAAIEATLQGKPLHEVDEINLHSALQIWGNPSHEVKL